MSLNQFMTAKIFKVANFAEIFVSKNVLALLNKASKK